MVIGKHIMTHNQIYFPQVIFDNILSFIITPPTLKEIKTYYISYIDVWFRPRLEKIEIIKIHTYYHNRPNPYCKVSYSITPFSFDIGDWEDTDYGYYTDLYYIKKYNMFAIEIHNCSIVCGRMKSIELCSRNTTNEATAFNILISRINRYSEYFTPVLNYCEKNNIIIY